MDVIYQWFEKQVINNPNAIAIRDHNQSFSYQALMARARALAVQLQANGVKPDTLVAICLPRNSEQLIGILAILIAGGAYVPFDLAQQEARIVKLLNLNHISLIITSTKYAKRFERARSQILCIEHLGIASTQDTISHNIEISNNIEPHHLAYLIHTSGSTGVPKGVLIEQQSVINYCRWFQDYTNLQPGCVIDYSNNYIFDMAITTSLLPLMLGCTVVICDEETKQQPRNYLKHLQTQQIQLIKLTPSYLKSLLQELRSDPIELPELSTLIVGGENLSTTDCKAWLEYFPHHTLFNEYGPTETTVAVTAYPLTIHNIDQYKPNVPIGQPGPHVEMFLLDSAMQPVPKGEIGELYVGGQCLSRGYHQQQAITAEKFIETTSLSARLYKTGDLCRQNQADIYEYLGRVDRQVKIRGYRIELGEIEHWLRSHPNIQDAQVVLSKSTPNQMLLAYCIVQPARALPNYADLRGYLLTHLPHYMIPNSFIPLDTFPLTSNGKLDENALPVFSAKHKPKPRTLSKLERQLIQIWTDELSVEHIEIHDNFYALGGHSLHAARIVSTITQKIGKKLSLAEFYKTETIAGLATLLKHRRQKGHKHTAGKKRLPKRNQAVTSSQPRRPLSDFQLLLWMSKTFEPKANQLNLVSRKRIQGALNRTELSHAFTAILKRHDIFKHRIAAFYPAYIEQKHQTLQLEETSLIDLSLNDCETVLLESIQHLTQQHTWSKHHPLVMLKLFKLPHDQFELQLCIPHLLVDEISLTIFWQDLSHHYLKLCTQQPETHTEYVQQVAPVKSFHDYIQLEQQNISAYFEQDCQFWDMYLQNTELVNFPDKFIVKDMASQNLAYSTYHAFPSELLHTLQEYCVQHQVGIEDVLCVSVNAALKAITKHHPPVNVINMVKSTRQDSSYDETMGCFLRVDPIRIETSAHTSLLDLSKQIRQNMIENAHFSQASNFLKLAVVAAKHSHLKKNMALKYVIGLYQSFLNKLNLAYQVLPFSAHFSSFKRDTQFIIYMNLWQNFLSPTLDDNYLGLVCHPTPLLFHDLSTWDNLCDVSFLRDEYFNQPYVVISSNLLPEVRENIAAAICDTLSAMIEEPSTTAASAFSEPVAL